MELYHFDTEWVPVSVYRNLNSDCWSVRMNSAIHGNLVQYHCQELLMVTPKFDVNENGRMRVLREKRKNVHAFVHGSLLLATVIKNRYPGNVYQTEEVMVPPNTNLVDEPLFSAHVDPNLLEQREVTYNPYKYSKFVYADDETIVPNIGYFSPKLRWALFTKDRKVMLYEEI